MLMVVQLLCLGNNPVSNRGVTTGSSATLVAWVRVKQNVANVFEHLAAQMLVLGLNPDGHLNPKP